jgi:predicted ATPase/DNA-binding winged helix-turn-helix (wHTH) protein
MQVLHLNPTIEHAPSVPAHVGGLRADALLFGSFEFHPSRSVLLKDGKRVRIGSRALALLGVLARAPGQFIPNDELMAAAWPGISVEDTNLRVQMAALRRLLGAEDAGGNLISNAPGRGYALTASVLRHELSADSAYPRAGDEVPHVDIPIPLTPLVGREEAIAAILDRLATRRLVSVVGPGGIGKTRVVVEVCRDAGARNDGRTVFVDLSPLAASGFVAGAVAIALGIELTSTTAATDALTAHLRHAPTLLVLDNCEHLLDATAELAEGLLRGAPALRILTTSREPLRVEGEVTVRLSGLETPEEEEALSEAEALSFPAMEMFVERASAEVDIRPLTSTDLSLVARICRRIDGIPLAIELAAARVSQLGLRELAALLDSRFALLSEGRRTGLPRHRTLRATLDWSYDALSENERRLLDRLSVMRASFSIDAAAAIAGLSASNAASLLSGLVSKSLVVATHTNQQVRYRLLETTRDFAEEKLAAYPDANETRRRHAAYFAGLLADRAGEDQRDFRQIVDDVRAAVAWGLSENGDAGLGVRLAIDSAAMWLRLSATSDYAHLLDRLATDLLQNPRLGGSELVPLYAMVHHAHYNALGLAPNIERIVHEGLRLANESGDTRHQLLFLYNLFGTRLTQGRYGESEEYAGRFLALARAIGEPAPLAMGQRIVGLSQWRNGKLLQALDYGEAALAGQVRGAASSADHAMVYKQGVTARANHANLLWLLWLLGRADDAVQLADEAIEVGLASDVTGLCYSLSMTIVPLSFWIGDTVRARKQTDLLLDLAERHDLGFWLFWGRAHDAALYRLSGQGAADDFLTRNANAMGGLHRHIMATIVDSFAAIPSDEDTGRAAASGGSQGPGSW